MPKAPVVKMKSFSGITRPAASPLGGGSVNTTAAKPPVTATPAASAAAPGPAVARDPNFAPGIAGLLDQQRSNIQAALKNTLGGITQTEDRGANDYGFAVKYKPEIGPNGERTVESIAVDPANPFSRAALLQRSYDNAKRGSTNSYAASGQLYSGSLQNAQDENTRGFQQNDNTLRQSFADFILGNEANRRAAVQSASEGSTAALAAALQSQLGTPPEDPGPAPALARGTDLAGVNLTGKVGVTSTPDKRTVKKSKGKKLVSNGFKQTGSVR